MYFMGEYLPYYTYLYDFLPTLFDLSYDEISNCVFDYDGCNPAIKSMYNYHITHNWEDLYQDTYQIKYRYKESVLENWNSNTAYYRYFSTQPFVTPNGSYSNE